MPKAQNAFRKTPHAKTSTFITEEFTRTTTELHPIEISQQTRLRSSRTEYHSNNTNEITKTNTIQNGKSTSQNLDEHQAYKLYKDSGEYWNNTPKTDYTYSRHSPHRRVLAPGVIAMPNMSRRSIHQNDSASSNESSGRSVNMMSLRKFEGLLTAKKRLDHYWGGVDTVDELDGSEGWVKKVLRVTRVIMVYSLVVSFWQNVWRRIVGDADREEMFLKRARVAYSEGTPGGGIANFTDLTEQRWYQRIWSTITTKSTTITTTLVSYFAYIYTAIAYSCVAGSKLIAQRTTNHPPLRYLTYVLLLLLIPLLLATGIGLYNSNMIPELPEFPSLTLPGTPDFYQIGETSQQVVLDTYDVMLDNLNYNYDALFELYKMNYNYYFNETQ